MKTNVKSISKRTIALLLGMLMLFSTMLVGMVTVSAYARIYFISDYYANWENNKTSHEINTSYGQDGKRYAEVYIRNGDYFALWFNDQSKQIGPGTNGDSLTSDGCQGEQNNKAWHFAGTTGYYKICIDQTGDKDQRPWVWLENSSSTITYKLHGTFSGSWQDSNEMTSANGYSTTINVTNTNTYEFGVKELKGTQQLAWYGLNGSTITKTSNNPATLSDNNGNIKIDCNVKGTYTFTFDPTNKQLTVTYPTNAITGDDFYLTGYINGNDVGTAQNKYKFTRVGTTNEYTYEFTSGITGDQYFTIYNGTNAYHPTNHPTTTSGIAANLDKTDTAPAGDPKWKVSVEKDDVVLFTWNKSTGALSWELNPSSTEHTITYPTSDEQTAGNYTITGNSVTRAVRNTEISFTVTPAEGYQVNSVKYNGTSITPTNKVYKFKMPDADVTITVTTSEKSTETVTTNKFYIRGTGLPNGPTWEISKPMTISDDKYYEYYEVTSGSTTSFLIDTKPDYHTTGNKTYGDTSDEVKSLANGTNVPVSVSSNHANITAQSSKYYILIYYADTEVNPYETPIICATSKEQLPNGLEKQFKIYAKDGTIGTNFSYDDNNSQTTNDWDHYDAAVNPTGFANVVDTVISGTITKRNANPTEFVNPSATGDLTPAKTPCYETAEAQLGKEITITTTIGNDRYSDSKTYRQEYYVKGWVVNGYTVGLNKEDTWKSNGVYSTTFTLTRDMTFNKISNVWCDNIEITPVFYHIDENPDSIDYVTFYVDGFDDTVKENWGNTMACYTYCYVGGVHNDNTDIKDLGDWPGQPMLRDDSNRCFVQVKTKFGSDWVTGMTLSNYYHDKIHAKVTTGLDKRNLQSYDYDDFLSIIKTHNLGNDIADNILFRFKYPGRESDNNPQVVASSSSVTAGDINNYLGTNNTWEVYDEINGYPANAFGEALQGLSADTTVDEITSSGDPYLRIVSNGYDEKSYPQVGKYATSWYVYAPINPNNMNTTKWKFVGQLPPGALYYSLSSKVDDAYRGRTNDSSPSTYGDVWTAINAYRDYPVIISYEGSLTYPRDDDNNDAYRADGNWYYQLKNAAITGKIKIQYETGDGTKVYNYDTIENGKGKVTGAKAHFVPDEGIVLSNPYEYSTTADSKKYFEMLAEDGVGRYEFDRWLVLQDDGSLEPMTKEMTASAVRLTNSTFVARYKYVEAVIPVYINYTFHDYDDYDGSIVYQDGRESAELEVYSIETSAKITSANNEPYLKSLASMNAPVIQSDYYDYEYSEDSFDYTYDKSEGIVTINAFMQNTAHIYSVTVNGETYTGKYQQAIELDANDYLENFGQAGGTNNFAVWKLADRQGVKSQTVCTTGLYFYRFIVDNAVVRCEGSRTQQTLKGKSIPTNSYYDFSYVGTTQKLTQNYYIINRLPNPDTQEYIGGGVLYYVGDSDGNPTKTATSTVTASTDSIKTYVQNTVIKGNWTQNVSNTTDKANGVGYRYVTYDVSNEGLIRYSGLLDAYLQIFGTTMTNDEKNSDKTVCLYSYFVYKTKNTDNYYIVVSDTYAIANAYESDKSL